VFEFKAAPVWGVVSVFQRMRRTPADGHDLRNNPDPQQGELCRVAAFGIGRTVLWSGSWSSRQLVAPAGGRVQAARDRPPPGRPTNACAARQANHASGWSSISGKNIPLLFSRKSVHSCAVLPGKRGGSRSSRNARWDAVDAEAMTDEAGMTRTAKSCGSDAAVLASSSWEANFLGATVAKEPFTGESTK
jgi:hypothetical protein